MHLFNHGSILFIFIILTLILGSYISTSADVTPVSDRTAEVQDAIVTAAGVNTADDVTETHLAAITELNLRDKGMTELKSGDFSGLTGLTNLNLHDNELSSLPDSIFEGLTALTTLRLGGNTVDPILITVTLEKVGSDQFKVVVPTGAPSDIVVPVSATNGSLTGDVTTLTVSKGSIESTAVTVSRIENTTAAVTANIGTLPGLPQNHYGYMLSESNDLPLEVISGPSVPVNPTPIDSTDTTENTAPEFTDGLTTTRSVLENTGAGMDIGSAVSANDFENDTLTYSLGGVNADSFEINTETGQLKTKVALEYEKKKVYVVTITVSDGELTDSISVTIRVIEVAETTLVTTALAVSDRTAEVRDAIVAAVGVSAASDVTADHLAAITNLDLRVKGITELKTGDFSGLSGMTGLNLYGNMLSSLPTGIFEGLTALTSLRLGGNTVDPMRLAVSLQQVSGNQYKAEIPAGAPFDVVLPINNADVTSITVSKGSVASAEFTGTASVSLGALPSLPADHYGYILTKSDVCDRTSQVSNVITAAVPGIDDCRNVTDAHLAAITELDLSNQSLSSLQSNDLSGLQSLTTLNLSDNQLSSLPDSIFSGLTNLTTVNLSGNTVDPFTLNVMLEKVGTNQFKVVVPTDAPFTMILPVSVSHGSISGGVETVTVSAGTMESSSLTVIRTSNTFNAVTVDISTLPSLPTGHTGYALTKSNQTALEIFSEINVAPEFDDGTTTSRNVAENTAAGENIGSAVTAKDNNIDDTLTYSLGGTNAAAFDIDDTSGQLKTKAPLDFEFKSTYTVTITVSDSVLTDTITVTINVSDIDETSGNVAGVNPRGDGQPNNDPTFNDGDNTSRSIAENTGSGVDIGEPVGADDDDADDTLRYSLGGTDASSFSINSTDGQLRTSAALDYEHKQSYTVIVNVSDGQGGSDSITVTINVTDVDESPVNIAPTFREGDSTSRSIAENTGSGVDIGDPVTADDDDADDTLRYSLGGSDAGSFSIDSTNGQLRTSAALDYERKRSYTVVVSVDDGEGGSDSITVTINVTDVDERPVNRVPNFEEGDSTSRSIAENTGSGVDIGDPVAADDDDADDTLRYSLGGSDAGSFSIDSTNGQLRTSAALDYEESQSYSVVVSVSDGQGGSDSITVTINVIDVDESPANRAPSFDEGDSTDRRVLENTGSGVDIGDPVAADDDDADDTLRYSLGGSDAGSFSIDSTNGQLRTSAALNYEGTQSYTVVVSVTDGEGGSDSITVTINVIDVDETPVNNIPEFTDSDPTTRSIAENTVSGVDIGSAVSATDHDGDTLSYTLGGTDAAFFDILPGTGQLKTSAALDHEFKFSYEVTVNVSDNKGGSDSISVTINVTDVNEVPEFTDGVSTSRTIAENVGPGINIGSAVGATDPENDDLTYTLGGTNAVSFDIESTTGQLKTKAALDFEEKSSYSVEISVTDGSLSGSIKVTITIRDLDEAPSNLPPEFTDGETVTRSVPENTPTDTNIGAAISAEDDDSTTLFYLLSGTDSSSFSIDDSTGQLKTNAALNFEGKKTYQVTVSVSDGSSTDEIMVTINITNVNEPPVFDTETARRSVDENTSAGQNIGQMFSADDPDEDDTLSYGLEGTNADAFDINSVSGQLQTKAALDFEGKNTYSVIVKASDSGGLSDTITVTINVRDVDENRAPRFTDGTDTERSVDENTGAGVDIGDPVGADDDDDDDTLEYSLGGEDAASFDINSTSGQLRTKAALDYEDENTYSVIVSVTDNNGGNDSINVTIRVNDVQENRSPTFSDGTDTERSVDENTGAGVDIGDPVGADDDDDDDTLEYSLGGEDAASFDINSTSGQLRTKAALDYEDENTYSVIVSVTDNNGGNDSINVTIRVNDVQENRSPTFSDGTDTERSVDENTGVGVDIGDPVTARDDDTDDTLEYSLGGEDAAFFDIESTSGQLRTKAALDYEDTPTYSVVVSVSDGNGGTDSINVTIKVNDVQENRPPEFTDDTDTNRSVDENTGAGVDFGTPVAAMDDDTDDTLQYSLGGSDAASFDIESTSGQLRTNAALDYEDTPTYSVVVSVSDGNGGTDSINVTINVNDVNEAPEFTDDISTTRSVAENTNAGENIGSPISASDPENDTLMYSLEGADAASFDIDSTDGQLKTKAALNYEMTEEYSVVVRASDNNLSTTIAVKIEITDVNEAPEFTANSFSYTISDIASASVEDNIGDPVTAEDPDNDTLSYSVGGTDAAFFTIVSSSGQLQVTKALIDGTESTYSIAVIANDNNGGTNQISGTVTVTRLTRQVINNTPMFTDGTSTTREVAENTAAGEDIGDPVAADDDPGDTLTYSLEGTDASSFSIVSTSGQLQTSAALDYEMKNSYSVTVRVTDDSGASNNTATIPVTINVTDVDEGTTITAVSNRTNQVQSAIVRAVDGIDSADDVTEEQLAAITSLSIERTRLTTLQSGDFDGLIGLTDLSLSYNNFTLLPTDIFDQLSALKNLSLDGNDFTSLPTDIFDQLSALENLDLSWNAFTTLPDGLFDGLTTLKVLDLSFNELTTLTDSIFEDLTALEDLNLAVNELTTLPADIFDNLSALKTLDIYDHHRHSTNQLTSLPVGIFDGLTSLEELDLDGNQLTAFPDGAFEKTTSLESITIMGNNLSSLSADVFDNLTALTGLFLTSNELSTLPDDVFDNNTKLISLSLAGNQLTTLPTGTFDELTELLSLSLNSNMFTSLPSSLFDNNTKLERIDLSYNEITSLESDLLTNLTELTRLYIEGNNLTSLPDGFLVGLTKLEFFNCAYQGSDNSDIQITVKLEKVADGQIKAVCPVGVPYFVMQPNPIVTNGEIDPDEITGTNDTTKGGVSDAIPDLKIRVGQSESEVVNVLRTAGTTGAVTVDIASVHYFDNLYNHGYEIVKDEDNLPIEVIPAVGDAPSNIQQIPLETVLLSNYPNPFNPETWIPYQLSRASDVKITIYNTRGVVVRELVLGHQKVGYYMTRNRAAHWDGKNNIGERVATGVYFCTFKAGNFTASRKMLIRK